MYYVTKNKPSVYPLQSIISWSLKRWVIWHQRVEKTYYGFLVTLGCLLSRKEWWAVRIGSFLAENWVILQTRMDQRGDHMKMNFEYFQFQKLQSQTVRKAKAEEKNGFICLVSTFPSWFMVLELSKKCLFLQLSAHLSKKSKSIKAIYIWSSERSPYALSENGIVYYAAMTFWCGDIIFWKNAVRTFRIIYVNCFIRLLKVVKNCKKCTFLDNLRTTTSERKHGNWTNDSIFSSIFLL